MFIVERGRRSWSSSTPCSTRSARSPAASSSVAAEKVEGALAKALPLAISFLASLLGLGGITDKIRESIDKVRKPIEKAVDFVVMGAVKGFKKMFGGAIGWVKGKSPRARPWVKDKATAAKEWGAGKVRSIKDRSPAGRQRTEERLRARPAGDERLETPSRSRGKAVGDPVLKRRSRRSAWPSTESLVKQAIDAAACRDKNKADTLDQADQTSTPSSTAGRS